VGTVGFACWHGGFELEVFLRRPGCNLYDDYAATCLGMCDYFWVPLNGKDEVQDGQLGVVEGTRLNTWRQSSIWSRMMESIFRKSGSSSLRDIVLEVGVFFSSQQIT